MAQLDAKKTYKNMLKKGFQEVENKSPDHKRIEFRNKGKLTKCNTKFSHGNKDINSSLISLMSKQVQLTNKQFIEFAKCTISEEKYIKILVDKGVI